MRKCEWHFIDQTDYLTKEYLTKDYLTKDYRTTFEEEA